MTQQPRTATGWTMRERLARLGTSRTETPELAPLMKRLRQRGDRADLSVVERAYSVAARAHEGQFRKSGDPYITHPVAVAGLLADLGMDAATVAAALLHDTVEDTPYSQQQLEADFGPEIALLVDGVTKLDKVEYGDSAQAETVRKMIVAMSKDIRVLVIKLADRLHNARTWRYVSPQSARRKAIETLDIYTPLAHRLGMNAIKWELEDLSFKFSQPEVYEEVVRQVAAAAPQREEYLGEIRDQLETAMAEARLPVVITGREKHYWSIYQKMSVRGRALEEIHDLIALRIMVKDVASCYHALGLVHSLFTPLPHRIKDYIATPKSNGYQSLHTTVMGTGGKPVEIQIRTHEMHNLAEYGVAAHWRYKSRSSAARSTHDLSWLRETMDLALDASSEDFMDTLRFQISAPEVFVFTPKGKIISLARGSTPVDLAYAIHTDVGHKAVGAKVNGRMVPLDSQLSNGDSVEILTAKGEGVGPSRDWFTFVATPRARSKIKQWFSRERKAEMTAQGHDLLVRALRKADLPVKQWTREDALRPVVDRLSVHDRDGVFQAIGERRASVEHVIELLRQAHGEVEEEVLPPPQALVSERRRQAGEAPVHIVGSDDVWSHLAVCCAPVPGDDIVGYVTTGRGVSVHRSDCANVEQLRNSPERLVRVAWDDRARGAFTVRLSLEALDRNGLVADVLRVANELGLVLSDMAFSSPDARTAYGRLEFELADVEFLDHVVNTLKQVQGIYSVTRAA
ncbi:bifunctional (p)ppGpp synthetase/guanosine-3',5'-bis(diphosphate) 3'-pyrophosphohydrolase [Kytococcus sedentarius]|uniref:(P)ppGpp synthetase, RelA/SpoT family n=1 Tax=Kytococcus sedentarius (strain ATCC 14392 / DSM 20547 / JCM 11482 / CCUG 33030 / NBRC 15357 / NCTC 11040 / CCM 314 / 541) TaxID=478801 RepID=C7NI41_KYTSD|nr:bifunctional (p)ppGpp synthetase/guanosine-3',5'-bis(diphosphate) 3'-pyrophosphohydrolase [Kytococcus sedentarius]ACV06548.1 (p)ppGpp synthetase, RelA/SpoT family [Kytococcus sedentarius DSM 20547]QQB64852.1 bifunctional (p)ppGpp synthetase/guanosine-3',5'-bis(diphosphate) 3'-pyrophosphohydrolase [Kytococcus sedentarius]STX14637.1 Bifunctional (p)ppGpp synthase/hydrolase relA [Kytococcus sedentarius]